MTEKLGKIVDPKTIRINPRHLVPGDTMKLPEGMTVQETESPNPFPFREPVKRD
jgi:hypothetical protein